MDREDGDSLLDSMFGELCVSIFATKNTGESALYIKAPTTAIQHLMRGAPLSCAWRAAQLPEGAVVESLRIHDNPTNPMCLTSTVEDQARVDAAVNFIAKKGGDVTIFDELLVPQLAGKLVVAESDVIPAVSLLLSVRPRRQNPAERQRILDDAEAAGLRPSDWAGVQLSVAELKQFHFDLVGVGKVSSTAKDEGPLLERQAFALLGQLAGGRSWPNPIARSDRKEVCDALLIAPTATVVVQAKADAVLTAKAQRSFERVVSNVERDIANKLSQTIGAIQRLRDGEQIAVDDTPIAYDSRGVIIGVIMVSELVSDANWKAIANSLIDSSRKLSPPSTAIVVLDTMELQRMVAVSGSAEAFWRNLALRCLTMDEAGTALIRGLPPP